MTRSEAYKRIGELIRKSEETVDVARRRVKARALYAVRKGNLAPGKDVDEAFSEWAVKEYNKQVKDAPWLVVMERKPLEWAHVSGWRHLTSEQMIFELKAKIEELEAEIERRDQEDRKRRQQQARYGRQGGRGNKK